MRTSTAPRIYGIPATHAPIVAIFRRGPSDWSHVGRWDVAARRYEPGAWLHGRIFPRRSDVSPDGRFLCYFAHKPGADWRHGEAYVALSMLPWLAALHAVPTCGTWTRGYHFVADERGSADVQETGLPIPYDLRATPAIQFASERRRGWVESADSPPRDRNDLWDERRASRIEKRQPGGTCLLRAERYDRSKPGARRDQSADGSSVEYWLEHDGEIQILDQVQWADWDSQGRLLVATRNGRIQIRDLAGRGLNLLFEEDLSALEPSPTAAPTWASRWPG